MAAFPSSVDLAIVGAGAAGIGAARAARDAGLRYVVVEALDRVGGRAYTDTTTLGVPWDQGCHWFHSAGRNPLVPFARQFGVRYTRQPSPALVRLPGGWASDGERRAIWAAMDAALDEALRAGAGRDVALGDLIAWAEPWATPLANRLMQENGWPADETSSADDAAYRARSTDANWRVHGYGTLIARLAEGLAISRATPARRIDWGGDGVRVETPHGTIAARAALITVSTNVLASGAIDFAPRLPDWKLDACAAVPTGQNSKFAVRFDRDVLGVLPNTFVIMADVPGLTFSLREFGAETAVALFGGPLCAELSAAGHDATCEFVRDHLAALFGSAIRDRIVGRAYANWPAAPTILGSYAMARPGQAHRRADLARPLADRLYFAGEATPPEHYTTAHGAFLSGGAAVRDILGAWRQGDGSPPA